MVLPNRIEGGYDGGGYGNEYEQEQSSKAECAHRVTDGSNKSGNQRAA